jgi:acyl-coenzyme A thioesterase PaaI-like protein
VVHRGRRLVLAEATIVDGAGRLLATATSSCLVFDLPT